MPPGFRFKDDDELDACGPTAVFAELGRLLYLSIIHVYALPNWPVRQLIDALERIAAKPELFTRGYRLLEQEAVAVLVNQYGKLSPQHMSAILRFLARAELLDTDSVIQAARNAVEFLKPQVRRGRPDDLSQSHLTTGLGELYLKYNPKIGRQVTGLEESGPFKAFVTLVVPPYRDFARMVGRTATVDNIVRRMSDRVNRQQAIEAPLGAD
jgi:hypothetical protein